MERSLRFGLVRHVCLLWQMRNLPAFWRRRLGSEPGGWVRLHEEKSASVRVRHGSNDTGNGAQWEPPLRFLRNRVRNTERRSARTRRRAPVWGPFFSQNRRWRIRGYSSPSSSPDWVPRLASHCAGSAGRASSSEVPSRLASGNRPSAETTVASGSDGWIDW